MSILREGSRNAAALMRVASTTLRIAADVIDPGGVDEIGRAPRGTARARDRGQAVSRPPDAFEREPGPPPSASPGVSAPTGVPTPPRTPSPPPPVPAPAPDGAGRTHEVPAPDAPPAHVSEDPVLVAESADAGTEGGAGAQMHIDEPWTGYTRMTAPAVVDRLAAETDAVVAVVALFEGTHRKRRSVLTATERELRRREGSAR